MAVPMDSPNVVMLSGLGMGKCHFAARTPECTRASLHCPEGGGHWPHQDVTCIITQKMHASMVILLGDIDNECIHVTFCNIACFRPSYNF